MELNTQNVLTGVSTAVSAGAVWRALVTHQVYMADINTSTPECSDKDYNNFFKTFKKQNTFEKVCTALIMKRKNLRFYNAFKLVRNAYITIATAAALPLLYKGWQYLTNKS